MKGIFEAILAMLSTWTIVMGILVYINLKLVNSEIKNIGTSTRKNITLYSVFAGLLSITVWMIITYIKKY